MKLDKKALERLLTLDDKALADVIRKLEAEAGLPSGGLNLDPVNIQNLRTALSGATDEDLKALAEQFGRKGNG